MSARTKRAERLSAIEAVLQDLLPRLALAPARTGRPEVLSAALLWTGMLVCIVRGQGSQLAIWRLLSQAGLWHHELVPISAEGVRKRLLRSGPTQLETVFTQVTAELIADSSGDQTLAPFATGVYALDDTSLAQVARHLPRLRETERSADVLLPGKLSVAFDVRRQLFAQVRPTELPHQNPKAAAPALYRALPPASLLLVDLGYFSFPLFDQLSDDGYWFISKQRRRTSATVVHTLVDQPGLTDELIWLGAYRADQARHLVRRITVTITTTPYVYLTNVLDSGLLSAADVVQLYGRRWDIELAFKSLKQHLGLGVVWSAHWELILTQVWGALLIAQIASALRQQIALRAGIDLVDVSLALLLRELPQVVRRGEDDIVGIIAGLPVTPGGFLRKARRVQYVIPVPKRIIPPPDDLVTIRMGRSSGRKCAADRSNRPRIGVPAGG